MTLELIEAARLLGFDPATGWPGTFAHDGLAKLQSWHKGVERKDWNLEAANWRKLMELALASGAMAHTTKTERIQAPQVRRIVNPGLGSHDWNERGFAGAQVESRSFLGGTLVTGYTQPARYNDVTRHHITAPAYAAWLTAQSIEPSPHITAWFKAQGLACPALAVTPAAPVARTKAKPRTWWDVSSAYIVEVMQAGQYATCKELYRALEEKAGPNAPFEKGTGSNRGSLFVREIGKPLSVKTMQNRWQELQELARK